MKRLLILILICFATLAQAQRRLEFTVHKLESGNPGPTVLVVGGIQGDEPGGFHAASLLTTNYHVTRGSIWVVPNLNFESIIKRSRGINGDMNRKFAKVHHSDPDYNAVQRIKKLITDPQVDLVLNLHDGSGFYRKRYIDRLHSPYRWGQSIIIDQEELAVEKFPHIGKLAQKVAMTVNQRLLAKEHRYHVKNTRTREGNKEMEKTLTYFAINNGKAAVGLESSKTLPTHKRAFYHLQAIEAFLDSVGIGYERDFKLEPLAVRTTIDQDLQIAFYQDKLLLDIANARPRINYFPLKKNAELVFRASNPLVAITSKGNEYRVNYGNRRITRLRPQFFEYDSSLNSIVMEVDGIPRIVNVGSIVEVNDHFMVEPRAGYRVNVIGWTKKGVKNECGQRIQKGRINKRFSVDRTGAIYRVELYKDDKFSGMLLVKFLDNPVSQLSSKSHPHNG